MREYHKTKVDEIHQQHAIDIKELEVKLTKVHLSNASLSEQQKLSFVFDKWRLLSLINKLQNGGSVEPNFVTDLL